MTVAISTFFLFPFAWNIFFQPLTLSLCVSLGVGWVFCRQYIQGSCFCIHSANANLCLFFGAFNPFWLPGLGSQNVSKEADQEAQFVKYLPSIHLQETLVQFLGWEDLVEKDKLPTPVFLGFPCGSAHKESACNMGDWI